VQPEGTPPPSEPPTVHDVRRIVASSNPVIRNLEITLCYARLSEAMLLRTGRCANWCTYATLTAGRIPDGDI
jgi:hypothetical protein